MAIKQYSPRSIKKSAIHSGNAPFNGGLFKDLIKVKTLV